ncbi:MAG: anti-sigma factor [Pseudomonadales bacterium]
MITCKDISNTTSDYLEGPSSLLQRFQLRLHLTMCKYCRRYFRQLQLTMKVASNISSAPEPDDEKIEELIQKLKQA